MIISHRHKFIFIKTRKTAGSSIEMALRSICDQNDIITPLSISEEIICSELNIEAPHHYFLPKKDWSIQQYITFFRHKKKPRYRMHESAQRVKLLVGDEIWDSYYKFSFERNPFDKAISLYEHYKNKIENKEISLDDFIAQGYLSIIKGFDLYSIKGQSSMDKVFRFEELEESLMEISNRLELKQVLKLPRYKAKGNNRDNKMHYSTRISQSSRRLIDIQFAREKELLGYFFQNQE